MQNKAAANAEADLIYSKTHKNLNVFIINKLILNDMKQIRKAKGKSLLIFPADYTVIDIETSGISPSDCEIIEISAVRYRNCEKKDTFSTLVKPHNRISYFITSLTGITNEMVKNAPDALSATKAFYDFAGDDILIGYNVNFDINFLYDNLMKYHNIPLTNDFVDVLRFARKALPFLGNRRQTTVAAYYGINTEGAHRALNDCEICNACYNMLKKEEALKYLL